MVSGRVVGLFMTAVLLSGCGSLELAYAFAEDMLESRAKNYLDLSPEEETRLELQSAALVAWHRRTMLPRYAAFFRAQADIAEAGGWTRAQFASAFAGFRGLVDETVKGASPFVAAVLADQTTPDKLTHLKLRMAEVNAERRAERAAETRDRTLARWVERRVGRISRFTGALNDDQVAIIRRYAARDADLNMRWLNNRARRQDALVAFLRTGPTDDRIARFVYRILMHAHELADPDYRAISEARWRRRTDMYFDVLAALSDDQRRELVSTLRGYAADMVRLAGV